MCGAFFWPGGSPCWTGDCAPRRSLQPCCPAKRGGGMRGASAPPMDPPLLLLFFSPLLSRLPCTHIHLHHNCGSLQSRASISADARIYRGPVVASKVPGCVSGAAAQTHPLAPWRERTHLCAPITAISLRYPDLTNE